MSYLPPQPDDSYHAPPGLPGGPPHYLPLPPAPPRRRVGRRAMLAGGAGLLLAAGGGVLAAVRHDSGSSSAGDSAGQWDPNTLPTAAGDPGAISAADIQALLDRKNRALKTSDRTAFTAPHAPATAAAAARLFDNLTRVPFDQAQYQLLGQGSRSFQSGTGTQLQVDVAFVHQVTGVDVRPVAEWYRWTLARSGPGQPVAITAVTGSPSVNQSEKWVYYPSIWDSPHPITVLRRPNVLLAAESDHDAAILASVADQAQQAVAENLQAWRAGGGPPGVSPGVFYLGTSNRDSFYDWFSGRANQHGHEAGLTIEVVDARSMDQPDGLRTVGGARVVLDLTSGYFTTVRGENTPKTLLKHEGWHALLFPLLTASVDSLPLWAVEGSADWAAKHLYPDAIHQDPNLGDARALATGRLGTAWNDTLPSNAQVYASSAEEMSAGYGISTLIFHYIYGRFGLKRLIAFLVALYQVPADASGINAPSDVAAAITRIFGMDLPTFQHEATAYARAALGV